MHVMPTWLSNCTFSFSLTVNLVYNVSYVPLLILETDSQEFVKLWKEGANQRSRIASIIRETRELSSSLVDFFVIFTSRACNRVALVLAKQVSGDDRLGEWQLASTCVVHMLASDCNPD